MKEASLKIKSIKEGRAISLVLCDHIEGWDREGGRETQEGGDMGIHVYV